MSSDWSPESTANRGQPQPPSSPRPCATELQRAPKAWTAAFPGAPPPRQRRHRTLAADWAEALPERGQDLPLNPSAGVAPLPWRPESGWQFAGLTRCPAMKPARGKPGLVDLEPTLAMKQRGHPTLPLVE